MKKHTSRRSFLKSTAVGCVGCCMYTEVFAGTTLISSANDEETINPEKLNYCGYKCPETCQFLRGSIDNDVSLKKEAYDLWEIKNRFNVPFDPDEIYCFGCKTEDKPEGIVLRNCTVRSCAMQKDYDSCIECDELVTCEKELWDRFPDFKKMVIEMQVKFGKQKL